MTREQLTEQIFSKRTYLCVGLDTDEALLPEVVCNHPEPVLEFNRQIIAATKDHCVAYKINTAFYEALGSRGWDIMKETLALIPKTHLTIADAKRGDIGNTSAQYAKAFFETLSFDAITLAPYMGADSIVPFLEYKDKWVIILGLTSNASARDFELATVVKHTESLVEGIHTTHETRLPLYEEVLLKASEWGSPDRLMFVIGATNPEHFKSIRALTPGYFYLVPGVGAQGGSLEAISRSGMTENCGLLVNASRAIIYAGNGKDFAEKAGAAARAYAKEMSDYLPRI